MKGGISWKGVYEGGISGKGVYEGDISGKGVYRGRGYMRGYIGEGGI